MPRRRGSGARGGGAGAAGSSRGGSTRRPPESISSKRGPYNRPLSFKEKKELAEEARARAKRKAEEAERKQREEEEARKRQQEIENEEKQKTPAMDPVEQRWEESQGKYLHKKFKKMAKAEAAPSEAGAPPTVQSPKPVSEEPVRPQALPKATAAAPVIPARPSQSFPLKHSALSMLPSLPRTTVSVPAPPAPRLTCPFCQLECHKPSFLDKHIRTHTTDRPFPCGPCGFGFRAHSNLSKHLKSLSHQAKVEKGQYTYSQDLLLELGEAGQREELESPPAVIVSPAVPNLTPRAQQPQPQQPQLLLIPQRQEQTVLQQHQQHVAPAGMVRLPTTLESTMPQIVLQPRQQVLYHPIRESRPPMPSPPLVQAPIPGLTPVRPPINSVLHKQAAPSLSTTPLIPSSHVSVPSVHSVQAKVGGPSPVPALATTSSSASSASDAPQDLSSKRSTSTSQIAETVIKKIDKIMSENQAIVSTYDPLWTRRYKWQHGGGGAKEADDKKQTRRVPKNAPRMNTSQSITLAPIRNQPVMDAEGVHLLAKVAASVAPVPSKPQPIELTRVPTTAASTESPPVFLLRQEPPSVNTVAMPPLPAAVSLVRSGSRLPYAEVAPKRPLVEQQQPAGISDAQSVKEVLINSCKAPAGIKATPPPIAEEIAAKLPASGMPFHPSNPEGSMIKELLLQSGIGQSATTVPSTTASATVLGVPISVNKPTHIIYADPHVGSATVNTATTTVPSSPAVSLILTNSSSTAADLVRCQFCLATVPGSEIQNHQKFICSQRASEKRPRLDADGSSAITGGRIMHSGGGIVRQVPTTSAPTNRVSHSGNSVGLLQIAQTGLQAGGGVVSISRQSASTSTSTTAASSSSNASIPAIIPTSAFSIPGVPTPSLAGVLTGIRSTPLFSLPGATREETLKPNNYPLSAKPTSFIPGMPGPFSNTLSTITQSKPIPTSAAISASLPEIRVSPASSTTTAGESPTELRIEVNSAQPASEASTEDNKFLRPTSLSLTPGSFRQKKTVMLNSAAAAAGATLVSPETPRPRKSYVLTYQNGTAYTHLGLKCSTRVCYCCISRPQPMFVPQTEKLSMYSNWKIVQKDSHPSGLTPEENMKCYSSIYRDDRYGLPTVAGKRSTLIVTHSSQWKQSFKRSAKKRKRSKEEDGREDGGQPSEKSRKEDANAEGSSSSIHGDEEDDNYAPQDARSGAPQSRGLEGGYKASADDEYTYVRGRGRGRYVCNSCGIRCKKPSMLKKHIRTHSNFRPYTCKYCNFAFKTKGNLTKHMKSKAHHKKCVELGISPVPTSVEEQATSEEGNKMKLSSGEASTILPGDSDSDTDDVDDSDDTDDEQFEDADEDSPVLSSSEEPGLGLTGVRPRLATYPYPAVTSTSASSTAAPTATTTAPGGATALFEYNNSKAMKATDVLSAPPNTAEKYYFQSKAIREKAADILSPVTESATLLSYIDKTVGSVPKKPSVSSGGENQGQQVQLQAYLQEKAVIRAKIQQESNFALQSKEKNKEDDEPKPEGEQKGSEDEPMKEEEKEEEEDEPEEEPEEKEEIPLKPLPPMTSLPLVAPNVVVSNSAPFAPRNVTMKVKELPTQITAGKALLPGLPSACQILAKDLNTNAQMKAVSVIQQQQHHQQQQQKVHQVVVPQSPRPTATLTSNQNIMQTNAEGKSVCGICKKVFQKVSQLRLHVNIHYMERPFKCEDCSKAFRSKGHLQKHERSATHYNKVNINQTFGAPSEANPRPFECHDCNQGFRIHGHLAKHLRSKGHIMKLEHTGKLPMGICAEIERLGTNLNEIDTTDCKKALTSLQQLAEKLYGKDTNKLPHLDQSGGMTKPTVGPTPGTTSAEETEEESTTTAPLLVKSEPLSSSSESVVGPESVPGTVPIRKDQLQQELNGDVKPSTSAMEAQNGKLFREPLTGKGSLRRSSFSSSQEDRSTDSDGETVGGASTTCNQCSMTFRDLKALQIHIFMEKHHAGKRVATPSTSASVSAAAAAAAAALSSVSMAGSGNRQTTTPHGSSAATIHNGELLAAANMVNSLQEQQGKSDTSSSSSAPTATTSTPIPLNRPVTADSFNCVLCGLNLPTKSAFTQHMVSHAPAERPFVCTKCDAGFTTKHQLDKHALLH